MKEVAYNLQLFTAPVLLCSVLFFLCNECLSLSLSACTEKPTISETADKLIADTAIRILVVRFSCFSSIVLQTELERGVVAFFMTSRSVLDVFNQPSR